LETTLLFLTVHTFASTAFSVFGYLSWRKHLAPGTREPPGAYRRDLNGSVALPAEPGGVARREAGGETTVYVGKPDAKTLKMARGGRTTCPPAGGRWCGADGREGRVRRHGSRELPRPKPRAEGGGGLKGARAPGSHPWGG
jgi:hypothetical protein